MMCGSTLAGQRRRDNNTVERSDLESLAVCGSPSPGHAASSCCVWTPIERSTPMTLAHLVGADKQCRLLGDCLGWGAGALVTVGQVLLAPIFFLDISSRSASGFFDLHPMMHFNC